MRKVIKVTDVDGKFLSITLSHVLDLIGDIDLKWSVLTCSGGGSDDNDPLVNHVENLGSSPTGAVVTRDQLYELDKKYAQIFDVVLIGCHDQSNLKNYDYLDVETEMYECCNVVLWLFDCSYWIIYVQNDVLFNSIAEHFNKTGKYQVDFRDHKTPNLQPNPHQHRWVKDDNGELKRGIGEALTN